MFNHQHEAEAHDPLGFLEKRLHDVGEEQLLTGERVSTASETAEAFGAFLRETKGAAPFYAQIGFFETHTPFDWNGAIPDRSKGIAIPPYVESDKDSQEHVASLQGSIAALDVAVGVIVQSIRDAGLSEDTLVIFTVDHGVELPRCKWELYDGGIRTALILHWPNGGVHGGRVLQSMVSNVDVVPTLLELIGVPIPDNIQGKSFSRQLTSTDSVPHRDAVFAMMLGNNRWTESRCVRTDRYKLIRNFSPSRASLTPVKMRGANVQRERPVVELYDLEADPHELNNIARLEEFRSTRDGLDSRLRLWMEEVEDPILSGPVPTPYYQMAIEDFVGDDQ